jgi:hypothetical protein
MRDLNPSRDEDERGTPAEFLKLRDAVHAYYTTRGLWFDAAALCDDFDLIRAFEGLPAVACPP